MKFCSSKIAVAIELCPVTARNRSQGKDLIPEEFFDGIAYLLPGLNQVAQECDLSIGEWIILWDLQHRGVPNNENKLVMLRKDLTQSLASRGFGEANITRLLNSLADKEHVRRISLTQGERDRLFDPSDRETRLAVVLEPSGGKKIDEFKDRLTHHVAKWRRSQRPFLNQKALTAAATPLLRFAEWFLKSAGTERT